MARISTTGEDEDQAASIVATYLGVEASRHDDGSEEGRHDFWLSDRDGELLAALEVTSLARETVESLDSALDKHGRILDSDSTSLTWLLDLSTSAKITELMFDSRTQIEELLGSLERAGVRTFVLGASNRRVEVAELGKLGISAGRGIPTADPQQRIILTGHPGVATWTGGDWTNDAVATVARKPDNLLKLSGISLAERHLFVWVFFSAFETWFEVLRGVPPPEPPDLPPAVTDVWIACDELFTDKSEEVVSPTVWHAKQGEPWSVIVSPREELS
jgi:hypothetical protein